MAENYLAMYKEALQRLSTGGMSLEASLQEIEQGKKQAIAGGQQALVSGGLGGTTVMSGVPLQAEKIAARQRLGARGGAERTYLTTLASFAAFAQRGEEAQKQRDWEAEQAKIAREESMTYAFRVGPSGSDAGGVSAGGGGGGGYADQFPSIYDAGGAAVPDWSGGGASATAHVGPSHAQATPGYGLADAGAYPTISIGEMATPGVDYGPEARFRSLTTGKGPFMGYVGGEAGATMRASNRLGAISDPSSPASRYTLGGYGGGF